MHATIGQRMGRIFTQVRSMVSSHLPAKLATKKRDTDRAPRQWASIMFLALLGAVGAGVVPSAKAATRGPLVYEVLHSGMCLEPDNASTSNSAVIEQHYCDGFNWQRWDEIDTDSGYVRIRNRYSGKCLNVQGASTANSAKVIQFTCGGSTTRNDQWKPIYVVTRGGLDYYFLKNRHSGKCLNVQGGSYNTHADLIQFTCSGTYSNDLFTWYY